MQKALFACFLIFSFFSSWGYAEPSGVSVLTFERGQLRAVQGHASSLGSEASSFISALRESVVSPGEAADRMSRFNVDRIVDEMLNAAPMVHTSQLTGVEWNSAKAAARNRLIARLYWRNYTPSDTAIETEAVMGLMRSSRTEGSSIASVYSPDRNRIIVVLFPRR